MSSGNSGDQSLGSIRIGNVITAALKLYRDHFKVYFLIALKASVWLIIPIYGWAKYYTSLAVISRLAYAEVREISETVLDAERIVEPRKWTLLWTATIIVSLIFGMFIVYSVVSVIIIAILALILNIDVKKDSKYVNEVFSALSLGNNFNWIILLVLLIGVVLLFVCAYFFLRIIFRYSLSETIIAIEGKSKSTRAMNGSLALTKGFLWQIQLLFLVAFLVSLPMSLAFEIIDSIRAVFFNLFITPKIQFYQSYALLKVSISILQNLTINPPIEISVFLLTPITKQPLFLALLSRITFIGLYLISIAILAPFWSCLRALLYYELKVQKEGLDLKDRLG